MAKIGISLASYYKKIAGTERYMSELMIHLNKLDKKNVYIVFCRKEVPENLRTIISERIKFIISPFKSRLITEQLWLPLVANKEKLDLLYSPGIPLPALYFKKSVVLIFDLTCFHFPQTMTKKSLYYHRLLFRINIKNASAILTTSKYTKEDLIDTLKAPRDKVFVTYLGVNKDFKVIDDNEYLINVKRRLQLPDHYFVSVGTLEPRKNYLTLIDAFAKFKSLLNSNYKLVLVGREGWKYKDIFDRVAESKLEKEVIFLGEQNNKFIPAIYNLADIFVLPTLFEGFGLSILESMACGTPVITSNISSIPEIIGNAGILVNPKDVDEIATSMLNLVTDKILYNNLKTKGLEQAKKFSWDTMTANTIQLFEKLTGNK